jgi:hypothetical protein
MKKLRTTVSYLTKSILFNIGLKRQFLHTYPYNFFPDQLSFFCDCIDKTKDLPGAIVEVGCALGQSTIYMNMHMHFKGIEKPYICLDTFSGFTKEDISYEVDNRQKDKGELNAAFTVNNKKWFDETIRSHEKYGTGRVTSYQADINKFDFKNILSISFSLIDVDLYIPVKSGLEKVYPLMNKGGIIVVDDCKQDNLWDGAYRAYMEFIQAHNLPEKIILGKLGIIEM